MNDQLKSFTEAASKLARNPLGIIALFLVLVYSIAAAVTYSTNSFAPGERQPLIYFLVGFPILVLGIFAWLVSKHSGKLFAPSDFRDEENYMKAQRSAVAIQSESKPPLQIGLAPENKPVEDSSRLTNGPAVTSENVTSRLQQVKNRGVPPIVQEQENLIREDIKTLGLNANQDELISILIRQLAINTLLARAEFIYRTIFGSQISLLKFLNVYGAVTESQLLQIYENTKAKFPEMYDDYSFEQYLQYLITQKLIITSDDEHYCITVAGQEVLKWITAARVSEDKVF